MRSVVFCRVAGYQCVGTMIFSPNDGASLSATVTGSFVLFGGDLILTSPTAELHIRKGRSLPDVSFSGTVKVSTLPVVTIRVQLSSTTGNSFCYGIIHNFKLPTLISGPGVRLCLMLRSLVTMPLPS